MEISSTEQEQLEDRKLLFCFFTQHLFFQVSMGTGDTTGYDSV